VPTLESPLTPPFTTDNTQYIDIKGGDILVVKRNRSLETWDVSNPSAPVRLAGYQPPDIHSTMAAPFRGLWIHEEGHRRYAFSAFRPDGFISEILDICDITDPAHPVTAARWWYPGMGESPQTRWRSGPGGRPKTRRPVRSPRPSSACRHPWSWSMT
jgi:hypothetical protein